MIDSLTWRDVLSPPPIPLIHFLNSHPPHGQPRLPFCSFYAHHHTYLPAHTTQTPLVQLFLYPHYCNLKVVHLFFFYVKPVGSQKFRLRDKQAEREKKKVAVSVYDAFLVPDWLACWLDGWLAGRMDAKEARSLSERMKEGRKEGMRCKGGGGVPVSTPLLMPCFVLPALFVDNPFYFLFAM